MSDIAMPAPAPAAARRKSRPMPAWKIEFYRQCRAWHGYLSAFAFLALMFFSATGILLNHPDWMAGSGSRSETTGILAAADIAVALKTPDPPRALSDILLRQSFVSGLYNSGEIDGDEAFLRYEGVKGTASVTVDLRSGHAQITRQKAGIVTILNDLHRGKNAGGAWKLLIDISAALFLILSLAGYILFFSLRFRLRQSLLLTVASLGLLLGLFLLFVP